MNKIRKLWAITPRCYRSFIVHLTRRLVRDFTAPTTLVLLLTGYAVVWTMSAAIRNFGLPLQGDMSEAYALSRDLLPGYVKHPPLINWITAGWFAIMPVKQWAYYLLAMLNAMLGLIAVWFATGLVAERRRQVLATVLLALTPIWTFHATTLNHNTIQLSLWPLIVLFFLLSINRSSLVWSIMLGLAGGLAILAKYYSILILVACFLSALLHPRAREYFSSARPYLAGLVFIAVAGPHFYWLGSHDFITVIHPSNKQFEVEWGSVLSRSTGYLAAFAGNLILSIALLFTMLKWPAGCKDIATFRNWLNRYRVVVSLAFVPIILPLIVLPFFKIGPHVAWAYPAYFFLPLVMVSAGSLLITLRSVAASLSAAILFAATPMLLSPLIMIFQFKYAKDEQAQPFAELGSHISMEWKNRTHKNLNLIASAGYSMPIAWAVSFYSPDHPHVDYLYSEGTRYDNFQARVSQTVDAQASADQNGILGLCAAKDVHCNQELARRLPSMEGVEVTLPVRLLWVKREPAHYVLYFPLRKN